MRTSLNEIKLIDDHIFNRNFGGDALLFDAMLVLNPGLSQKVSEQKKAHQIVHQYGRKKLKAEIESVHQKLFNEPAQRGFREKVLNLFYK